MLVRLVNADGVAVATQASGLQLCHRRVDDVEFTSRVPQPAPRIIECDLEADAERPASMLWIALTDIRARRASSRRVNRWRSRSSRTRAPISTEARTVARATGELAGADGRDGDIAG